MLSEFRRESGAVLDALLTQSLTSLIAVGLVTLEEVTIDGTKVQARAGRGSMAQGKKLTHIEAVVAARVAALRRELEQDAGAAERRRQERALRAAEEQAARVKRAAEQLAELEREKAERAKRHAKEEAAKSPPAVSSSDPEVRLMRMADGATRPAWNVQVATSGGFVVTIEPTDRRNDSGLARELVEQVRRHCGRAPSRLLADTTAMTQAEIVDFAQGCPDLRVYSPPPTERAAVSPGTVRNRRYQRRHEPPALSEWRTRMASEDGTTVYRRRKLTEHVHAKIKNRGFGRMPVHGIAKVRVVCLLHALAHNLLHAHRLRAVAA